MYLESVGRKYVFGKYGEEVCIWKVWGGSMYLESMGRKYVFGKYVFGKYGEVEEVCIWKVWRGSMYLESVSISSIFHLPNHLSRIFFRDITNDGKKR